MSLTINNNLMALNSARHLNRSCKSLATSVQRLSSGLRVNSSADDAAGLAIRELMRADIAACNQGIRNCNDAISMVQTADGALQIIDEKLIRMKELAEQAATGTYTSDQRLLIDAEFQAMASEIERIATATTFNGVHLLDGSLQGEHDGNGLESTGSAKIHFGTSNSSAEDYYYISTGDATIKGLGLAPEEEPINKNVPILSDILVSGGASQAFSSGVVSFAVIPKGSKNITIHINDNGADDTIQIFTRNGEHIVGTTAEGGDWRSAGVSPANIEEKVLTEANGFLAGCTYDDTNINGLGGNTAYTNTPPYNVFSYGGTQFGFSGSGNASGQYHEYLTIDETSEDLVMLVVGSGRFYVDVTWGDMPPLQQSEAPLAISIQTQSLAQQALDKIDNAMVQKDAIRANLGAMQNRLENTVSNLSIQAENLQASESRISDVDVAVEMTDFIRNQILTQSATAILSQANSMPQMVMQLIQG